MGVGSFFRVSVITKPLTIIISFLGMVVISRLLSPDEIGVQVLAASVVLVVAELRNMGVGSLIIREKELTKATVHKAFTVLVITSSTIAITLILMSEFIADFFNDERVSNSLIVVACSFFLIPFYSVTTAALARDFAFYKVEAIRVTEVFIQQLTPIVLALYGFGYISIPLGILIASIVAAFLSIALKPNFINYRVQFNGIVSVFKRGGLISLASMLKRLATQFPEMCLGFLSGTSSAAFYSRANGIPNFTAQSVNNLISPVISPYFSREKRGGDLNTAFILSNMLTQPLILAPLIFLGAYGAEVVVTVFGDDWRVSGELLPVIALSLIINNTVMYFEQLMIMSKHEKVLSIYQLGYLVCTVIACASLAILLGWKFIVYGILIASVIALSTKILLLKIYFEGILSEFMRAMGKNLVILSLFSFAIFIVKYFCSDIMASWKLIVEILILGFFYLAVLFIFKHELLNRVISILKGK
jgi:O-antigen/teichoic acid export membrane protein